jgi:hypothetical protein
MPTGIRNSVYAMVLASVLGSAQAATPATTWSDPPAHKTEAEKPAAPAAKPVPPTAATEPRTEPTSGMAVSPRRKTVTRRATPKVRSASRVIPRPRQVVVARHPVATPRAIASRPLVMVGAYPAYRVVDLPPDYEDARLERIGPALRSGYLVMRRRTITYPDGQVIRIYRPAEGDDD